MASVFEFWYDCASDVRMVAIAINRIEAFCQEGRISPFLTLAIKDLAVSTVA